MHFQWYPGHMTKARRMMQEDMKLIDVVIELVDARIPYSSKNPDIDELAKNKTRVILLNKYDLADKRYTELWKHYFEKKGYFVTLVNSKNGNGVKQVNEVVQKACQEKIERDRKKGILNRPIRAMVVGIPNVGKSTFINSFAGKASTKTGNKPGVTKGKQWIRLNKNIELLDTPGILWPKFEDQAVGLRLAMIGSIREEILNIQELAFELIKYLVQNYKGNLSTRYQIDETMDVLVNMNLIAEKRACRMKGGELDLEKAAGFIVDDFRSGKLGNITLEFPNQEEPQGV
ncbi:MAG: GTP-binding protein HSR1-related [Anaerocolumna sp.]|nr:GTP-binding protein HSR1-related [Anaerocolumna sp.]